MNRFIHLSKIEENLPRNVIVIVYILHVAALKVCTMSAKKGNKREEQRKIKLCVLDSIREQKEVLFGPFSATLTKEKRNKAWTSIGEYAKSIGALPNGKDSLYVRDVWWPNVRKMSMVCIKFD